jgi:protein-S-isoprenylcysteine O-methyltransferase Ste14
MTILSFLSFAVAGLTLLRFGLGMKWFQHARERTASKRLLEASAYVSAFVQLLVILISPPAPLPLRVLGVALYVLALVVFGWARLAHGTQRPAFVGVAVIPSFLTQTGPYRVIRHPIYTGYLLAWFAGPVIAAQPWLLLPAVWMFFLHYRAARQEELSFAHTPFARDYAAYQRRTGMFVPNPFAWLRPAAKVEADPAETPTQWRKSA